MTDAQRSMFIRSLDEAKTAADPTNAQYPMIHPSGVEIGTALNPSGTAPANLGWQSLDNIEKALKILRNPEAANISEQLGGAHKIRSFYNNIIEPNAPQRRCYGGYPPDRRLAPAADRHLGPGGGARHVRATLRQPDWRHRPLWRLCRRYPAGC